MGRVKWAILTGQYPPTPGGVADYTRLVARELAAAGDVVTVYAPVSRSGLDDSGVTVHSLPDRFGPLTLLALDRALARPPCPDRILVQYVPQAYGYKGMNVPFVTWLAHRARRYAPLWVMFHEVMFGSRPGQPRRHALLSRLTQHMARQLASAAERIFVSIPAWGELLNRICPQAPAAYWLPVPSNIPATTDPAKTAQLRKRIASNGAEVIGHFGTYGKLITDSLGEPLAEILRRSVKRVALLVGRNGPAYRERFTAKNPDVAAQVFATGALEATDIAMHLSACDILFQPYPDGASCRRTTLMTAFALGKPTVTNLGCLSEPIWTSECEGVTVARSGDPTALVEAVETVLALTAAERLARGRAAAAWYEARFAPAHMIAQLRSTVPINHRPSPR